MSQVDLYAVRCGRCGAIGRDDWAKTRAGLNDLLSKRGWVIGKVILCPACREAKR